MNVTTIWRLISFIKIFKFNVHALIMLNCGQIINVGGGVTKAVTVWKRRGCFTKEMIVWRRCSCFTKAVSVWRRSAALRKRYLSGEEGLLYERDICLEKKGCFTKEVSVWKRSAALQNKHLSPKAALIRHHLFLTPFRNQILGIFTGKNFCKKIVAGRKDLGQNYFFIRGKSSQNIICNISICRFSNAKP